MTTWLEFRSEPMAERPEVDEYITSDGWTLKCMAVDCSWTDYSTERTENWMDEMHESIQRHQDWHENGMPE